MCVTTKSDDDILYAHFKIDDKIAEQGEMVDYMVMKCEKKQCALISKFPVIAYLVICKTGEKIFTVHFYLERFEKLTLDLTQKI